MYEEPAKLNTARATSKNGRTLKNKNESTNSCFKRIPAKRIPRRKAEYLTGLIFINIILLKKSSLKINI